MYSKDLIWDLNHKISNKPTIALTFDDGPIPLVTPFVLEELKKWDIKATFFVVGGNLEKHPDIFLQVIEEGHSIGNHTFNHLKGHLTPTPDYFANIKKTEEWMEKLSPLSSQKKLFRPPYGRITKEQIALLKNEYSIIMWDVLTHDYNPQLNSQTIFKKSCKSTSNGSIVVFHDNQKSVSHLQYLLPRYIENFLEKGFQFEVL